MVLSRFWLTIFISSIVFVVISLFSGNSYTIDYILNGKKDDPILLTEKYIEQVPAFIKDSIKKAPDQTMIINRDTINADTTYVFKNKVVKIYSGVQKSDGLLPTCKNTLVDLILPLIAYLAFFCGLMELLIISGATQKLAKVLSPVFVKVFPSIPKNHPSISYMTLNFAANFLGLDSAATPFGLKAMESLQEINPEKDKASDAQIMFMCLHASGLTLIATSIIGYRAAANASNPADVMLPCIITSFIGTIAAFLIVGIKQKINFKSASLVIGLMTLIAAIVGLLLYVNHLDLIGKNYFTSNLSALILVGIYMSKHLSKINFNDLHIGVPAFFTMIMMPLTYSISNGIAYGFACYIILALFTLMGWAMKRIGQQPLLIFKKAPGFQASRQGDHHSGVDSGRAGPLGGNLVGVRATQCAQRCA